MIGRLNAVRSQRVESHLARCGACASRLPEAVHFARQLADFHRRATPGSSSERRREPRIATNDPAKLRLLHPFSLERLDIRIVNVPKTGLGFRVPRLIELRTVVQVRLQRAMILGEIRFCVQTDTDFRVGVAIQDVFQTPFAD